MYSTTHGASHSSIRRGSSPMVRASGTVKVDPMSSVAIPQGEGKLEFRIRVIPLRIEKFRDISR